MDLFGFWVVPALACIGVSLQGVWLLLTPVSVFILIPILDRVMGDDDRDFREPNPTRVKLGQTLCVLYVPLQLCLILWGAYQVSHLKPGGMSFILTALSIGLATGGTGITVAHELIHRSERLLKWMGSALLSMVCYGHFTVEHVHGHHTWVGTERDPASAKFNESLFHFFPRTLIWSWLSAWKIEKEWLNRKQRSMWKNRIWVTSFLSIFFAMIIFLVWGLWGLGYFFLQSFVAITLLEIINYVEHYGLRRRLLDNGKWEPFEEWHSWDSRRRLSNSLLINLQHHSDHHQYPARDFPRLRFHPGAPLLPCGYPEMVLMALVPPLWFYVMNKRCEKVAQLK